MFPHCFSSLYDFKLDFIFILVLINSSYFTIIYLKNISKYLAIDWKKCSLIDTCESLAKKLYLIKHVQNQTLSRPYMYVLFYFSINPLWISISHTLHRTFQQCLPDDTPLWWLAAVRLLSDSTLYHPGDLSISSP